MDLISVSKLISAISVHYPAFKKNCMDEGGKISKAFCEEWHRHIGHLDFYEALNKLDNYIKSGNKFAPNVNEFLKESVKCEKASYAYEARNKIRFEVIRGRLYDQEGREYSDPGKDASIWSIDPMGRILCDGMLVN